MKGEGGSIIVCDGGVGADKGACAEWVCGPAGKRVVRRCPMSGRNLLGVSFTHETPRTYNMGGAGTGTPQISIPLIAIRKPAAHRAVVTHVQVNEVAVGA